MLVNIRNIFVVTRRCESFSLMLDLEELAML